MTCSSLIAVTSYDHVDSKFLPPGSHGERVGAGGGCDRERRALPERRQRPASQIHQRVRAGAEDHHVAPRGAEKSPGTFY